LCADWLPEGVAAPVVEADSNALVVQGPEAGVKELVDLIEQLDRRTQQIIFEITWFPALPGGLDEVDVVDLAAPDAVARPGAYVPAKAFFAGEKDVFSIKSPSGTGRSSASRVATMSLLPVLNAVSTDAGGGTVRTELVLVPRVSSDGTITVATRFIETGEADDHSDAARLELIKSAPAATVSVRDGETFGLIFARADDRVTVIARPRLVR
jgi:hypothetical protein